MTCIAGNMFRSHDKRAHGLLLCKIFFVLAAQGTKNLYVLIGLYLAFLSFLIRLLFCFFQRIYAFNFSESLFM